MSSGKLITVWWEESNSVHTFILAICLNENGSIRINRRIDIIQLFKWFHICCVTRFYQAQTHSWCANRNTTGTSVTIKVTAFFLLQEKRSEVTVTKYIFQQFSRCKAVRSSDRKSKPWKDLSIENRSDPRQPSTKSETSKPQTVRRWTPLGFYE